MKKRLLPVMLTLAMLLTLLPTQLMAVWAEDGPAPATTLAAQAPAPTASAPESETSETQTAPQPSSTPADEPAPATEATETTDESPAETESPAEVGEATETTDAAEPDVIGGASLSSSLGEEAVKAGAAKDGKALRASSATFNISSENWSSGDADSNKCAWNGTVLTVNNGADITVTGTVSNGRCIEVNGTATITLNGVSISNPDNAALRLNGSANLTLTLANGSTNTLTSSGNNGSAGIYTTNATLRINGTGTLNANGARGWPGIGGKPNGTVIIDEGTVTATGGGDSSFSGAGIGGGDQGAGGTIRINGGNVTATGYAGSSYYGDAAAIGGGGDTGGNAGDIEISGGVIKATTNGNPKGAIGNGNKGNGGSVKITGGSVQCVGKSIDPAPTNGNSKSVYLNTLSLQGVSSAVAITAGRINGVSCATAPDAANGVYGIRDVKTAADGKLYYWLPSTAQDVVVAVIQSDTFYSKTYTIASNNNNAQTLENKGTGSYDVTYNSTGHTNGAPPTTERYWPSEVVTVRGNTGNLAYPGKGLSGWTISGSGLTGTIQSGGTFEMPSSGVTLTAAWVSADTVFNINEGKSYPSNQLSGYDWDFTGGVLTINGTTALTTIRGNSTATTNRIEVKGTSSIILDNVNIAGLADGQSPLLLNSNANLDLTISGTNTLTAGKTCAGVQVPSGNTLTIGGSGSLTATATGSGDWHGAGIGGGNNQNAGEITINSGTITATGTSGAGIGGGYKGNCGLVTINGGVITARSTDSGAGIGSGSGNVASFGTVVINGGSVRATSPNNGAGIGGGYGGNAAEVTITGGTVIAEGLSAWYLDDIGRGNAGGNGGSLTITGGSVKCTKTAAAAPTNGAGQNIYLSTLTLGATNGTKAPNTSVSTGSINGVNCAITPNAVDGVYGIKDVKTDADSKVYFWLPEAATAQMVSLTAGNRYEKSFTRAADNTTQETLPVYDTTAPTPGASGAITIANIAVTSLTLNWTAATDNINAASNLKYYVYRSESNDITTAPNCAANGTLVNAGGTLNIATLNLTGLTQGKAYYFNVVVEDEAGNKVAYGSVSATPRDKEPTPTTTINYANETLTGLTGNASYTFGVTAGTANAAGTYPIGESWMTGANLSIVKNARDNGYVDSDAQPLAIPARPAAPTATATKATVDGLPNGKITGVTTAMQYRKSADTAWTDCGGTEIIGLAQGEYKVRTKQAGNAFVGAEQTLTIGYDAAQIRTLTVAAPTFASITYGDSQPAQQAITITNSGNFTATLAPPKVEITDVQKDGSPAPSSFLLTGSGDTVAIGGSIDTWKLQPKAGLEAGTYTAAISVVYDGTALAQNPATATVSFTVNKKQLTVTGIAFLEKYYDGGTSVTPSGTPALAGKVSGDDTAVTLNATGVSYSFEDKNAGTTRVNRAGNYTLAGAKSASYQLTQPATWFTSRINKAPLTITGGTITQKTYDGKSDAEVTAIELSGLVTAETLDRDTDYEVTGAAFNNQNVAQANTVTATVTLKNTENANNYALTSGAFSKAASIQKRQLSWSADGEAWGRKYDTTTEAAVKTPSALTNVVSGETVEIATGTLEFASADIGTHQITAKNYGITGAVSANYLAPIAQPIFPDAEITAKDDATLTTANIANKVYSGDAHEPALTVTDGGTQLVLTRDYTIEYSKNTNAGIAEITLTGAGNYAGSTGSASFVITPKELTITDVAVNPKTYDRTADATVTELTFGGLQKDQTLTLGEDYAAGNPAFDDLNAGSGKTVSGTASLIANDKTKNYTVANSGAYQLANQTIAQAEPVINPWPNAAPITYGETIGDAALIGGDATYLSGDVPGNFAFVMPSTEPTVAETGTQYNVTFTPTDATNYKTVTGSASVAVNQKSIANADIEITGDYEYSGELQTPEDGDITVKLGAPWNTLSSEKDYTYAVTSGGTSAGEATLTVTGRGNYAGQKTQTFRIDQASVEGVDQQRYIVENYAHDYEFDLKELLPILTGPQKFGDITYSVEDIDDPAHLLSELKYVSGDTLTLPVKSVSGVGKVAEIEIMVFPDNYENFAATITLVTTNKDPVVVSAAVSGGVYSGQPQGIPEGIKIIRELEQTADVTDEITPVLLYESADDNDYESEKPPAEAGTYQLTIAVPPDHQAYVGAEQYVFVIAPKPVTLTADNVTIKAGSPEPKYTYKAGGLVSGDKLTKEPKLTAPEADLNKPGTYPIVITGADAGDNYDVSYAGGTLTVQPNLPGGSTIVVPPGGRQPVENADGSITIPDGGTITLPDGKTTIETPPGTVVSKDGDKITLPEAGASATMTLPDGSAIVIPGGSTISGTGTVISISQNGSGTVTLAGSSPASVAPGTVITIGEGGKLTHLYPVAIHFGTWTGSGTASARIHADHTKFVRLTYEGKEISAAHYTVTEGSTIITLKAAHLDTYVNGDHEFIAHFSDGASVPIKLTVRKAGEKSGGASTDISTSGGSAQTGDEMNLTGLWIILAASAVVIMALAMLAVRRRKQSVRERS